PCPITSIVRFLIGTPFAELVTRPFNRPELALAFTPATRVIAITTAVVKLGILIVETSSITYQLAFPSLLWVLDKELPNGIGHVEMIVVLRLRPFVRAVHKSVQDDLASVLASVVFIMTRLPFCSVVCCGGAAQPSALTQKAIESATERRFR